MSPLKKLIAILAVVGVVAGGSSCSRERHVESSDEVTVTLTAAEPAVEGDLVVWINDRVRGDSWEQKGEPAPVLEDLFHLHVDLSPRVDGVRVSLVPVEGPDALVVPTRLQAADGHREIPVGDWYRESRTSFVDGGTFDVACPVGEPCEVAFRYRIELVVPLGSGERVEVAASAVLRANELGPGGRQPLPDGAEMTVELHQPAVAVPIVEAVQIGSVPVTGRKHRGELKVPVTIRYPEPSEADVVRFLTPTDPEVQFAQDQPVITAGGGSPRLSELPLMIGDCDLDGCVIEAHLFTDVEPDAGEVIFWAYVRSGWNLHAPPSDLAVEIDLSPEALPPAPAIASDPDD